MSAAPAPEPARDPCVPGVSGTVLGFPAWTAVALELSEVSGTTLSVLISPPCPLPSVGLLPMSRGDQASEPCVWDDDLRQEYGLLRARGANLVMSDANQACRLLGSCLACRAAGRASAPRVVLVAAAPLEECVAGCLSGQSRQQELLDAVRKLADTAQADVTTRGNLTRGGMAFGSLRRVREHIERQLADKVRLRELAVIAGLSAGHFSRAFRQSVGMSPHRYLQYRRVAAAADLIRNTNRPLAEIALSVGFSDQSHFTRIFARARGETPMAFRRRHR